MTNKFIIRCDRREHHFNEFICRVLSTFQIKNDLEKGEDANNIIRNNICFGDDVSI